MEKFEKDLLELPKKLQYRQYTNEFQRAIKEKLSKIEKDHSNNVIVPVDKTNKAKRL